MAGRKDRNYNTSENKRNAVRRNDRHESAENTDSLRNRDYVADSAGKHNGKDSGKRKARPGRSISERLIECIVGLALFILVVVVVVVCVKNNRSETSEVAVNVTEVTTSAIEATTSAPSSTAIAPVTTAEATKETITEASTAFDPTIVNTYANATESTSTGYDSDNYDDADDADNAAEYSNYYGAYAVLEEYTPNLAEGVPTSMNLGLSVVLQRPSLPTGCEITSLTSVLNYYGFDVSKETMADDYLDYGYTNFFEHFIGNPYSDGGWGCFAPVITNAANKYLMDVGSELTAYNISGSSFDDILAYVASGHPVVIWNTISMSYPYVSEIWYINGEQFLWMVPEHCVVLYGYDVESNEAYVADPWDGDVVRDLSLFASIYKAMYAQAVIID